MKGAWYCSGASNRELVTNLFTGGIITSNAVRSAMLAVDRAHYAPRNAYKDSPQSIGYSVTISAPHMHAHAAEELLPSIEARIKTGQDVHILDVGSGSGYLTHVLAEMVRQIGGDEALKQAKIVGIEHIKGLVDLSRDNLRKSDVGKDLLDKGVIDMIKGDGRLGYPEKAPYDAIHVGAAASEWHEPLTKQLRNGGRLFIPVGTDEQHIWLVEKDDQGETSKKKLLDVRYVPLTDAPSED
jgi:protein-L-isoaspartate(D-aspartate) O-methyltransferase